MASKKDFQSDYKNQWCPGCGNFGILDAMKQALSNMNIPPENILLVSGIGQAAKTPHFLRCNFFHTLHGRALPVATGAKLVNPDLSIIVNSGDGDCYGEGGNHFIHAVRRNIDLTLLVHNNQVYGLTKGQASPTSMPGMTTSLQPGGVVSEPVNGLALALTLGAGFVARGFSGNPRHLSRMIRAALSYKGFSIIDILQPCVSFNRINTLDWYKERIYEIDEKNPDQFDLALKLAFENNHHIPLGILYHREKKPFTQQLPGTDKGPLVSRRYKAEPVERALKNA